MWRPDRDALGAVRDEIVRDPTGWRRVRDAKRFRDAWHLGGESLKRAPRGYPDDHPLIEDLKRSGVYVSPKGRLQNWIDLGTENRAQWVNLAMQSLHEGQCPAELKAFVDELLTYLQTRSGPARATRPGNRTG